MNPTPSTRKLIERLRSILAESIMPLESAFLQDGSEVIAADILALRAANRRAGLWAPHIAAQAGGMGLSLTQFAYVSELLGRSPIGHHCFNCQAPDASNMEILHRYATAAQRRQFLEPLIAGQVRSCYAMTEPNHAGSNPAWMNTTATQSSDGWILKGRKWFITSADGADFALVMAVTDPEAPSHHARASQFLVPADTPGFHHVRRIKIMGEEGSGWFSHSELVFDDCRLPADALLGSRGAGFAIAQERLGPGRIHHCMRWLGICARVLDMTCRHGAAREVAPGQKLGTRQSFQHALAESRAEVEAARALVLSVAAQIEAQGQAAVRDRISLIKFHVAGVLQRVVDRAIQAHGAVGTSDELALSYWYRHERCARIYDGTDEVHKTVVARAMLAKHGLNVAL